MAFSPRNTWIIGKREFRSYFESPIAYVFMIVFLFMLGILTFMVSDYFRDGEGSTDLQAFFMWHPWMYLFLVPAASMRLWSEERNTRTIETLLTFPVTLTEAIVAKFLAAWLFLTLTLLLTFPMVLTNNYLGNPDQGAVIGGYIGSILIAGAYLSIGTMASACTRNQVVAFVIGVTLCMMTFVLGLPQVTGFLRDASQEWAQPLINALPSLSVNPPFDAMQRGVIDIRDVLFFISIMVFMLFSTYHILQARKGR